MEGTQVVTSEMGHIFKTRHAIPRDFLHEQDDGVLHATVAKQVVSD